VDEASSKIKELLVLPHPDVFDHWKSLQLKEMAQNNGNCYTTSDFKVYGGKTREEVDKRQKKKKEYQKQFLP